jgi:hypothetical protein
MMTVNQRLAEIEEAYHQLFGSVAFSPQLELRFKLIANLAIIIFSLLGCLIVANNFTLKARIDELETKVDELQYIVFSSHDKSV